MSEHRAPSPKLDALERAWRSFKQNVLIDALAAIGAGLTILLGQYEVTTTQFWTAAGILAAKSIIASLASYLHRLKRSPKKARPAA